VLRFGNLVPNYWALVLTGIVFWSFFSTALTTASSSFVRNGQLITKVYFPIEALPFSLVLSQFVNFLITLAILLIAAAVKGVPLGLPLVLLPVLVAATLALALGVAALAASITVFFRDVEHLITIGLTALFYLTPVIYPLDPRVVPAGLLPYLKINPLAWYVDSLHAVIVRGQWPSWRLFTLALVMSALSLAVGYLFFLKVRPRVPEEV
jgi:ABC-2 type transport system permease protein